MATLPEEEAAEVTGSAVLTMVDKVVGALVVVTGAAEVLIAEVVGARAAEVATFVDETTGAAEEAGLEEAATEEATAEEAGALPAPQLITAGPGAL